MKNWQMLSQTLDHGQTLGTSFPSCIEFHPRKRGSTAVQWMAKLLWERVWTTKKVKKRKTWCGDYLWSLQYFCRLKFLQFEFKGIISSACQALIFIVSRGSRTLTQWFVRALTSMTWTGEGQQQCQEGTDQERMQGSHIFVLKVKSSTLTLKTLHSEGTEWVSSFRTCYKILLYVKGQGWGGTTRGTPFFQLP